MFFGSKRAFNVSMVHAGYPEQLALDGGAAELKFDGFSVAMVQLSA